MSPAIRQSLFILCSMLFISGSAVSETMTLDECIVMALKKNYQVIQTRNQAKIADGTLWQAFGAFLPTVGVSISASQSHSPRSTITETGAQFFFPRFDTLRVPPDTIGIVPFTVTQGVGGLQKSYGIGASASLTIFNGGRNVFNYLGAKADKKYYRYLSQATENDIVFGVKSYYFSYLKALNQLEISKEAVKRGEEQLKLAQSRYDVGSASKSDVLKAQVQYGNDKLNLINAENTVRSSHADMAYYIGLDVNDQVEFSVDYKPRQFSGTEDEALKTGMMHHPGLLASENNLTAAKYDVRSTLGSYMPVLSVGLSKGWSNSRWSELKDFRSEDAKWTFSTSLNIPIFENFSRKRDMTRAKATYNNARASYWYAKNSVALEIKKAYLEITRSEEALKVAQENVLAAEEDMSLIQEKYNLGAATILELIDAQVSSITAKNAKAQSEFDLNLAIANLEKATGVR